MLRDRRTEAKRQKADIARGLTAHGPNHSFNNLAHAPTRKAVVKPNISTPQTDPIAPNTRKSGASVMSP